MQLIDCGTAPVHLINLFSQNYYLDRMDMEGKGKVQIIHKERDGEAIGQLTRELYKFGFVINRQSILNAHS